MEPKTDHLVVSTNIHASGDEARAQVAERLGNGEIDDSVALTVASWYAGHDYAGRTFTQLATTRTVNVVALHDACHTEYAGASPESKDALDMLCTWASNHPSRTA